MLQLQLQLTLKTEYQLSFFETLVVKDKSIIDWNWSSLRQYAGKHYIAAKEIWVLIEKLTEQYNG